MCLSWGPRGGVAAPVSLRVPVAPAPAVSSTPGSVPAAPLAFLTAWLRSAPQAAGLAPSPPRPRLYCDPRRCHPPAHLQPFGVCDCGNGGARGVTLSSWWWPEATGQAAVEEAVGQVLTPRWTLRPSLRALSPSHLLILLLIPRLICKSQHSQRQMQRPSQLPSGSN